MPSAPRPDRAGRGERARVGAAIRATYIAFAGAGFGFSSWASRIPQVKDRLGLDPSALGLVLLAIAAGSVIALPLSGLLITRYGSRRTVATLACLAAVGLAVVAAGYETGVGVVVVGLFLFGVASGGWDVAMNVQGAIVERRTGRAIMSRFHAGFSLGTVAGALLGAVMVALAISVTVHLLVVALLVGAGVTVAVRRFLGDHENAADAPTSLSGASQRTRVAWSERRTLLIGVFVLAFAFAEGTANDWLSVAMIDGHGAPAAVGRLALAAFLAAMTAGRWAGPSLLARYGRVAAVRVLALVAIAGLALFVYGGSTPAAFAGALLWGGGVSLGFPVGMSAGADDPAMAATRVSVVSSIGYCAFLGGPPLVGFLGHEFTVLRALSVVIVLLVLATTVSGSVRPGAESPSRDGVPPHKDASGEPCQAARAPSR